MAYGVMSFIMTATPISMNKIDGFLLAEAKEVIQAHIIAMFLPSFFTSWLIKRMGVSLVMIIGVFFYGLVMSIGLLGQTLLHYWFSLIILGMGWNFLFLSGTVLLGQSYSKHDDQIKLQAINDFSVFMIQAIASLCAGWVVLTYGWSAVMFAGYPIILFIMIYLVYVFFYVKRQ